MADSLRESAGCTDDRWLDAFTNVPRHLFLDTIYECVGGRWSRASTLDDDAWLMRCYSAATAEVTALTTADPFAAPAPVATSPAVVTIAALLQALDVDQSQRHRHPHTAQVLEVGTGCGYTAALLAHRLKNQVTSVDIDPDQTTAARIRTTELGLAARFVTGDSASDLPEGTWDRVLVSHTIDRVPAAWLRHIRPDGIVVADLGGGLGSHGLMKLRRVDRTINATPPRGRPRTTADARAGTEARDVVLEGSFLDLSLPPLSPSRSAPNRRALSPVATKHRCGTTAFDPRRVAVEPSLRLLCQLHLPPSTKLTVLAEDYEQWTRLTSPDGSWVQISHSPRPDGSREIHAGGRTNLAHALESAERDHLDLRGPVQRDFTVTVTYAATTVTHHNDPQRYRWEIPSVAEQTFGASA